MRSFRAVPYWLSASNMTCASFAWSGFFDLMPAARIFRAAAAGLPFASRAGTCLKNCGSRIPNGGVQSATCFSSAFLTASRAAFMSADENFSFV